MVLRNWEGYSNKNKQPKALKMSNRINRNYSTNTDSGHEFESKTQGDMKDRRSGILQSTGSQRVSTDLRLNNSNN